MITTALAHFSAPDLLHNDAILKYLIPTVVTLTVFMLGLLANWLKGNSERRRETRHLKAVFMAWIPHLKRPVELLAGACDDLSARLTTANDIGAQGFKFNHIFAEKLSSVELRLMIKTFITNASGDDKLKNKYLYQMVSTLEFLDKKESEITAKYEEHYSSAGDLLHEWNEKFIKFSELNLALHQQAASRGEAWLKLDRDAEAIRRDWGAAMKEHPGDTKVSYTRIVEPIILLLKNFIHANGSDDPVIGGLTSAAEELKITFRQWEASHSGYSAMFSGYAVQLNEAYVLLSVARDFFNNHCRIRLFCQ
ncbi:hypothetical protein AY601_1787 [Pedobacter cryoconitis]|uniref:Uncharacterized protein n=1 Tax=Pedobacter cryoconitis TaxID=188932 RepID=A0A127VCJ1_9SPHI|nr:hypothetical protein [Pedobacter cryoconitis]AMP98698.1 hypothetical protein AY601_1787 [Pedobacter cryoconitis]